MKIKIIIKATDENDFAGTEVWSGDAIGTDTSITPLFSAQNQVVYYWKVIAKTESYLIRESSVFSFSVCSSTNPNAPTTSSIARQNLTPQSPTFSVSWSHDDEFGISCGGGSNEYIVKYGQDPPPEVGR